MATVIAIEDVWKKYRLGVIGHGTLTHDLQSWWARLRGKEDPNSELSFREKNDAQVEGESFWALRGLSLQVEQGQILGIVGANGAGKSTLLKILSRVTAPTMGEIKIKGRVASLLEVGTGFHPELTGRENVFMNGAIMGMDRQEILAKLDEIIDFSGVGEFVDTPVKRYSSGMRVRLGFAVAAHLDPEILIVDEVLAVGDAAFQRKCLGKMGDISKSGRTVLFVSHNMASLTSLCTAGVLIENGRLEKTGSIKDIVDAYLSPSKKIGQLLNTESRRGSGELLFASARVYPNPADTKEMVVSRGKLYLELLMEKRGDFRASDVRIDLRIDSAMGTRLIWMSTGRIEDWELEGERCVFVLDDLPLNQGRYVVTLFCAVKGIVADWIQNAFTFEVRNFQTDYAGKTVDPSQSNFLMDYRVES